MTNDDSDDFRNMRPDKKTRGFVGSWLTFGIGIIVVLGVVFGAISFFGGWGSQPAKIFGASNVREQWSFAYEYDESLKTAAQQVCIAEKAVDSADADVKSQRETQLIAMQNNYNRIKAEYNGRLRNAFEAKWVRPKDVPEQAPELEAMKQAQCPN